MSILSWITGDSNALILTGALWFNYVNVSGINRQLFPTRQHSLTRFSTLPRALFRLNHLDDAFGRVEKLGVQRNLHPGIMHRKSVSTPPPTLTLNALAIDIYNGFLASHPTTRPRDATRQCADSIKHSGF